MPWTYRSDRYDEPAIFDSESGKIMCYTSSPDFSRAENDRRALRICHIANTYEAVLEALEEVMEANYMPDETMLGPALKGSLALTEAVRLREI
jgi:hypothetical protein